MTVSIRRLSLGAGYEYLLRSVARGDGAAQATSPLTRYYAESGTPPGRFLGAGLAGLGNGSGIAEGAVVTEEALFRLIGMLADPSTGEPLGHRPPNWPTPLADRIATRVGALGRDLGDDERAGAVARIEREEQERQITRPVAGFDLTFSVPKSVSTVWAIAGPDIQTAIYQAHLDAIGLAVGWAERNVFFSRSGAGGVVQEDVRGVVAAAFDHWDSRSGDPHLHTHVVVANRAQSVRDGEWRSLDSRTLFRYTVALSELHEGILEDLLTDRLGYGWDERARAHSAAPRHDIAGVPDELITGFSRRSGQIETETAHLIARWASEHGRQPSDAQILRLRQQATLATRPDKDVHSLAEQTETWRVRARPFVGGDTAAWADSLRGRVSLPALSAGTIDTGLLHDAACLALDAVAHKRSTFNHANVLAEVHRQLHGCRFASPADRLAVAEQMATAALAQALRLDPPAASVPEHLRRPDGPSRLVHRGSELFTTLAILDAESRLLAAARETDGPTVTAETVAAAISGTSTRLGPDQAAAVRSIASSGRRLDVLVGPAGSGKTASLAALRAAWEAAHGPGSVVGLAPSAAAADVLAAELGVDTENTAKWLHEAGRQPARLSRLDALLGRLGATSSPGSVLARRLHAELSAVQSELDRWRIHAGQLVVIDEAGLAGTVALDGIVTEAVAAGAKVVLVGDPCQLSAIEAGGAYAMLVDDRAAPPELTSVRRFRQGWERNASRSLRAGDTAVIATYETHDRIRSGSREDMLDAIYRAWRADTDRRLCSLMIANDSESVAALNLRAREDRVTAGAVGQQCVEIAAGGVAGVGDQVVTRENNRRLVADRRWVKNGDQWTVTALLSDGSIQVARTGGRDRMVLPADYVRRHVELGYAATAYRAQGRTVDTAHALVDERTSREVLYVSATRGRDRNTLYVDTTGDEQLAALTARDVLDTAIATSSKPVSAHEYIKRSNRNETAPSITPWSDSGDPSLGIGFVQIDG